MGAFENSGEFAVVKTNGGKDTVTVGTSASTSVDGGTGFDTVDLSKTACKHAPTALGAFIDLNAAYYLCDSATFHYGLVGIEGAIGTKYHDSITGTTGDNVLEGRGGEDSIDGLGGADLIAGGTGDDVLHGGPGNDVFDEGSASNGADVMFGDGDVDTVTYVARSAAVTVSLDNKGNDGAMPVSFGRPEGDNVQTENVTGGGSADTLTGDSKANVLKGNGRGDTLSGAGGDDTLDGGLGFDNLNGGAHVNGDTCKAGGTGTDGATKTNCEKGS
jgi:Ca2+-binding RTX toxin-like protein